MLCAHCILAPPTSVVSGAAEESSQPLETDVKWSRRGASSKEKQEGEKSIVCGAQQGNAGVCTCIVCIRWCHYMALLVYCYQLACYKCISLSLSCVCACTCKILLIKRVKWRGWAQRDIWWIVFPLQSWAPFSFLMFTFLSVLFGPFLWGGSTHSFPSIHTWNGTADSSAAMHYMLISAGQYYR